MGHTPADIVRQYLIDNDLGTLPSAGETWPVFVSNEPNSPNNAITVYNTEGRIDGRSMQTGEQWEHPGVQIRVRATDYRTGHNKAELLILALDEQLYRETISLSGVGGASGTYLLQSVSRTAALAYLGVEPAKGRRHLFTINAVVTAKQQT